MQVSLAVVCFVAAAVTVGVASADSDVSAKLDVAKRDVDFDYVPFCKQCSKLNSFTSSHSLLLEESIDLFCCPN